MPSSSSDLLFSSRRRLVAAVLLTTSCITACNGSRNPEISATHQTPLLRSSTTVVFIGDSITERWATLPQEALPLEVINAGVSGETSAQILARFNDDAIDTPADMVVILAGTNDILKEVDADPTNVERMALDAHDAGMAVIVGMIPATDRGIGDSMTRVANYNAALEQWCIENGVPIADYFHALTLPGDFTDGIHPNAAGYAKMWTVVGPLLAIHYTSAP